MPIARVAPWFLLLLVACSGASDPPAKDDADVHSAGGSGGAPGAHDAASSGGRTAGPDAAGADGPDNPPDSALPVDASGDVRSSDRPSEDGRGDGRGASDDGQGAPDARGTEGCPGAEAYLGDASWKNRVHVTTAASYCTNWTFGLTIKQELAAKAMVQIAAGDYPIIDRAGSAAFGIPFCLRRAGAPALGAGPGTVKMGAAVGMTARFEIAQPFTGFGSVRGELSADPVGGVVAVTLDGQRLSPDSNQRATLYRCLSEACSPGDRRYLDSCSYQGLSPQLHTVAFEGGSIELEMRFDRRGLAVGIEPAAFVRGTGTFAGVAFDQRDYFKLIYSPSANHHFIRHFAVLFDTPIQGACGLEIDGVSAGVTAVPHVYTVTCGLERIAERAITSGPTVQR